MPKLLITLVFLITLLSCNKSTKQHLAEDSQKAYSFDYQLLPSSTYLLSTRTNSSIKLTLTGEIDSAAYTMPGMLDMLNSESFYSSRAQSTLQSGPDEEPLLFEVTIDSIFENKDAPETFNFMENLDVDLKDLSNKNLIGQKLTGFSLDKKGLEKNKDSVVAVKSLHRPLFLATKPWSNQKDLPGIEMKIGETYIWEKPERKKKKRKNLPEITATEIDSIINSVPLDEQEEKRKEMEKYNNLKKYTSRKTQHFKKYTLVRVVNDIAHFEVEENMNMKSGLAIDNHLNGKGKLEYDLKDHYFRFYHMEYTSSVDMAEGNSKTEMKSTETTTYRIQKIK